MALLFSLLRKSFRVLAVKNKHHHQAGTTFSQPPDLHVNLDADGHGWVAEVQLILKSFLEVKKTLHKYYDLTRAQAPELAVQPVFRLGKGAEDEVAEAGVSEATAD